jgi:hypothetical protein
MSQGYLSVAIWEPLPGKEDASLTTTRELNRLIAQKGYGHDQLYRAKDSAYLLLRQWNSEQAQKAALEDPELQRRWARLANEIRTVKVYEKLEAVDVEAR